jgi:exonuclease III
MKIVSLNIEGRKHLDKVVTFLERERADIICLLEAPEDITDWLSTRGYQFTFAPKCLRTQDGDVFLEGIIFASKIAHEKEIIHYYVPDTGINIVEFDIERKRATQRHFVLLAELEGLYIGVTHFTWNPKGEKADKNQTDDMNNMLDKLAGKPPHILCGDFNIPRHQNKLYENLTAVYTDNIPPSYHSSLDKNLHRFGATPSLQKLFDSFMVDYLFSQPGYTVSDVKLEFGISDHAAVIGTISKD